MNATDVVRQAIDDSVSNGSLLPGDPINENELMERFKVSRTPVREALLQLQAQGIVTSLPRAGTVVAKMDVNQLMSMWEVLAELEGVCIRLACERMGLGERAQLQHVHAAAQEVADANDFVAWREANLAFHDLIYAGSRNLYLRQEILRMRARTGAYRDHAFAAVGNIRPSWDEHTMLLNAILARDAESARDLMVKHLSPGYGAIGFTGFLANLPKELLD